MNNRIEIFKAFTQSLASLSKCTERHVAAIITNRDMTQVYSIGVNGGPKGLVDCMCVIDGKYGCIHAEMNALIKDRSADSNKVMFVTLAPCKQCAAAIVNSPYSFSKIYYFEDWKNDAGLKILSSAGINVIKI